MKRLKILAILGVLALAGCSNNQLTPSQQIAWIDKQNKTNTLKVTCPAGGCTVEYTDPRDRVGLPKATNGYDVANKLISTAGSVAMGAAPWAAVSGIARHGISAAGTSYQNSHNADSTHNPTIVTQPDALVIDAPEPVVVQPVVVNPLIVE